MNSQRLAGYLVAFAVVVVGLVALGVPLGTLLLVPLVLACPLMMILMMRGMGGMDHGSQKASRQRRQRVEDVEPEERDDAAAHLE